MIVPVPVCESNSVPDFHLSLDVKKKALPMWIREGLEKLEKKKQKKQDQEEEDDSKKSNVNLSTSGSSSIAGYDHGKVDSPVGTPKSNDSDEVHVNLSAKLSFSEKTTVDILMKKKCLYGCKT